MKLDRVAYLLILLYPITAVTIKVAPPLIFVLLALIGVYMAIKDKVSPFTLEGMRLFSWITFGYFFVMVISVILSNEPTNDWTHLSRKVQFLLAPFVGLIIYRGYVSFVNIITAVKIGISIAGFIVLSQYMMGNHGRLSGMYNPNSFADMLTIMIFVSMIGIVTESRRRYIWSMVILFLGVCALVLSGARGSLLVFVIMLPLFAYLQGYHKRVWIAMAVVILSFSYTSISMSNLHQRVKQATIEVENWQSSVAVGSSVGIRLEMYRSGLLAFADSPWIGYGYRNANIVASRYATPIAQKRVAGYTHLHNEILTNMVSAGLMGLLALLVLYLLPLGSFVKDIKNRYRVEYSRVGIVLIVGYFLLGMTHGMLEWEYENSFFLYFLAISLLLGRESLDTKV